MSGHALGLQGGQVSYRRAATDVVSPFEPAEGRLRSHALLVLATPEVQTGRLRSAPCDTLRCASAHLHSGRGEAATTVALLRLR